MFSQLVGESGLVISIEPSASNCVVQAQLVDYLGLTNVKIINALVTDENRLNRFDFHKSSLDNSRTNSTGFSFLLSSTLDEILDQLGLTMVDFLKINIEGDEKVVVPSLNVDRIRNICISCHDFTGDPTQASFDMIVDWALGNKLELKIDLLERGSKNAEDFYVYASSPES